MKKTLPAAIALAGSLGLAGAANAVNVNHDGLGQVLLYSYYTVEDGNDSLFNITNTTSEAVAVKIRFVEAMNSQEVLDFNLYLSPYDVWTGAVTATSDGAKLVTTDTSCTVPAIPAEGVEFRNFAYSGTDYTNSRGGPQGLDRTRTGYLEAIEMGVLFNESANPATPGLGEFNPAWNATHVAGVPRDCSVLSGAWAAGGAWAASSGRAINAPEGGLYGSGIIVNVQGGTDVAYDATALDNFFVPLSSTSDLHRAPGSVLPSLQDALPASAVLSNGTTVAPTSGLGIDAVSIVLQKEEVANDYLTVASLSAGTDWVVTFPTKRFYVNGWVADVNGNPDDETAVPANNPEPFTNHWTDAAVNGVEGSACEPMSIKFFDQEEGEASPDPLDFSPQPPAGPGFALCYEANILSVNNSNVLGGGYTRANLELGSAFQAGWIDLGFTGSYDHPTNGDTYTRAIATNLGDVRGLPAIGFAVIQFVNGDLGGLLSNYAGLTEHKSTTTVIVPSS